MKDERIDLRHGSLTSCRSSSHDMAIEYCSILQRVICISEHVGNDKDCSCWAKRS